MSESGPDRRHLGEVAGLFLKLGLTAFGGPSAHVALMREEAVRRRRWLSDAAFLEYLGAANLLPGPTSTELALFLGRARAGWLGMVVAGALFLLPAVVIVLVLAVGYVAAGATPEIGWLLYGVQPVIVAIVAIASLGLARTAFADLLLLAVGLGVALATVVGVEPLVALLGAGTVVAVVRNADRLALRGGGSAIALAGRPEGLAAAAVTAAGSVGLVPLALTFLKIGAVTYGSGYALLAFLRADLVVTTGWLTDAQLIDAVAAGQVTPGPLFTTATFAGFLVAGLPGAIVATVAIFLPGFLLAAAAERLLPVIRRSRIATAFLAGAGAAAVGLMAAVTLQLGRSALVDPLTIALFAVAALLVWRSSVSTIVLIGAGALLGVASRAFG